MMLNKPSRLLLTAWCLLLACGLLAACAQAPLTTDANRIESVFVVQAPAHRTLRVLTRASACPSVRWDGQTLRPMTVRATAAAVPVRSNSAQKDSKPSVFDVLTCEATWPAGAQQADVAGREVTAPRAEVRRIVIVADTGCRMKASEDAFQACNDPVKWPFAQVAQSAALLKPDLVIHIGDAHYRESPCPQGNAGCANAAWGYGFDAWQADFFTPAAPLLAAAPWLFVRGNHESCFRAGQGWFRFLDSAVWTSQRSCDDPQFDNEADYTEPFAVAIAADTQLVVFDSSKASGKPYGPQDPAFGKYTEQLRSVGQLAQYKAQSFFLSHHPLLAAAPTADATQFKPGGTAGLQSVFSALHTTRLFPDGVSVAMHGHVHLFEAMSFQSAHPVSLVMGNSGSLNEGLAPNALTASDNPYPGAVVQDYASRSDYGFATLDRLDGAGPTQWLLTEYTPLGVPVIRCHINQGKSVCKAVNAAY